MQQVSCWDHCQGGLAMPCASLLAACLPSFWRLTRVSVHQLWLESVCLPPCNYHKTCGPAPACDGGRGWTWWASTLMRALFLVESTKSIHTSIHPSIHTLTHQSIY